MTATRLTSEMDGFTFTITITVDVHPRSREEQDREDEEVTDAELARIIADAGAEELAGTAGEEEATDDQFEEEQARVMAEKLLEALGPPAPSAPEPAQVEPLEDAVVGAVSGALEEVVTPEMAELRALQSAEKECQYPSPARQPLCMESGAAPPPGVKAIEPKPRKTKASPRPPTPDPDEKPDPAAEESKQERMLRSELALKIPIAERRLQLTAKQRIDNREQYGHCQTLQTWGLGDLQTYYGYLKDAIQSTA